MTNYVELELESGTVKFEVDSLNDTGVVPAMNPEDLALKTRDAFNSVRDTIRITAAEMVKEIRALELAPDEVEVEFGIKIDAEAGAIVAKAGTGAHYHVTLIWKERP